VLLLLVTDNVVPTSTILVTLIMETIRRNIPEDGILHRHCRESLKSYTIHLQSHACYIATATHPRYVMIKKEYNSKLNAQQTECVTHSWGTISRVELRNVNRTGSRYMETGLCLLKNILHIHNNTKEIFISRSQTEGITTFHQRLTHCVTIKTNKLRGP
jgi:hypothetical protein